jgi:hydrogenase-1 operon protein HyaF
MKLQDIPVSLQPIDNDDAQSTLTPALLTEIADHLEALQARGATGLIDLRGLPMTASDRSALIDVLGLGEVTIQVDALGRSEARETGYAGVWWVEHRSPDGMTVAEHIEIAPIPQIAPAHPEDIRSALTRLRARSEPGGAVQ